MSSDTWWFFGLSWVGPRTPAGYTYQHLDDWSHFRRIVWVEWEEHMVEAAAVPHSYWILSSVAVER